MRAVGKWVGLLICLALVGLGRSDERPRQFFADSDLDPRTLLDAGRYEDAEVAARKRFALVVRQHGEESLQGASAGDLLVAAAVKNGNGSAADILAVAERSLSIKRAHLGALHPDLALSLLNLATVLTEIPDYRKASELAQAAVTIREASAGAESPEVADALDTLGWVLAEAQLHDRAIAAIRRELRIRERMLPAGDVDLTRTLMLLASTLQATGDYVAARPFIARALATQGAPGEGASRIETLNVYATQLWFEGRVSEARDYSEQAVASAERLLRPSHPTTARALTNLAAALTSLGEVQQARSIQQRALAIAVKGFGEEHHKTAFYLNELANSNLLLGDYAAARAQFGRALKIAEGRLGGENEWVATLVHNLALVDAHLGDVTAARLQHDRAMAIWERVLDRDHPFVAVALTELAVVMREQGGAAEALPLLERALTIRERSLGPDHRDVAQTLVDMAATLSQLGQSARAQFLASRALQIWEESDAPDSPDFAQALAVYAELQAIRGDAEAARTYYARALAIRRKAFGEAHPAFADAQVGLARSLAQLGDRAAAVRTAVAGESAGRDHLRLMLRSLPERQSLSYAVNRPKGLDLLLSLAADARGESPAPALDALIRSRALVLDEMASRARVASVPDPNLTPLRAELDASRQRLVNLVVRGPGNQKPEAYVALVDEAREAKEQAERTLAERSASFGAELLSQRAGLDEIRRAMPTGSVLLSFVRYGRTDFSVSAATAGAARAEVPSYLAFVLRPEGDPIVVPLGSVSSIDALVARWRSDISNESVRTSRAASTAVASVRASGTRLRKAAWDPVGAYLSGSATVFVVPDDALSLVSFDALPGTKAEFLIEEAPIIHYLAAERDLLQRGDASGDSSRGLLAVGGPAFDDASIFAAQQTGSAPKVTGTSALRTAAADCGTFQTMNFPPLAGTLREVRDIAQLWNRPGRIAGTAARVLVANEATERLFKQQAPQYQVIHLATHGFSFGSSCPSTTAGLRAVGGLVGASSSRSRRQVPKVEGISPLLLSGVALAGANRRASAGVDDEDGILTAEEVLALDLAGVQWAVLSACETGMGQIRAGEGVFGLRRAFQIAGVRTVIMSLWSVDDQATRLWMRALYQGRLQRHLSTADAVREASLTILRDRRAAGRSTHPFYWAAFVAAGDWR